MIHVDIIEIILDQTAKSNIYLHKTVLFFKMFGHGLRMCPYTLSGNVVKNCVHTHCTYFESVLVIKCNLVNDL